MSTLYIPMGRGSSIRRTPTSGLTLSEWVRDVLLAGPGEGGPETAEVILAEQVGMWPGHQNLGSR
jgi:hypothetical protein